MSTYLNPVFKQRLAALGINDAEALTVLRGAREIIRNGWTRGKGERDGRFCAVGALVEARKRLGIEHQTDGLTSILRGSGAALIKFNDKQKTKRPVLALFDEAIAELEPVS